MKWIAFSALLLLAAACGQDTTLVSAPTPLANSTNVWGSPPPTPTYKIAEIGPDSCYGNADGQDPRTDDPDDPLGASDAYECLWKCAIDSYSGFNTPSEFEEIWDFDIEVHNGQTTYTQEEYGVDPVLANYPWSQVYPKYIGPCNSVANPAP